MTATGSSTLPVAEGLADGVDVAALGDAVEAGVATPGAAQQHLPEPQLGGLLDGVEDRLVLLAGDRDDDVVAGRGDLGLRDAEAVDAVADDRHRLVERVRAGPARRPRRGAG